LLWFFCFFFISGLCSLIYEVVWLRLAMAEFGVTTPMVSIVLSVFMVGLGLGSWGSGRLIRKWDDRLRLPPLRLYALTEFLIGISALLVPLEFSVGRRLMHHFQEAYSLSSLGYYCAVGVWISISLVPWCACMGATFPCAMFAIKRYFGPQSVNSFSYLYLANVLGAMTGAILPTLLIEEVGFHGTLVCSALLNFLLAISAWVVARANIVNLDPLGQTVGEIEADRALHVLKPGRRALLALLLWTGCTSMAAEVVWVRMFTAWLGTVVYAFAAILALYLGGTYIGSLAYRRVVGARPPGSLTWALVGVTIISPLLTADPRLPIPSLLRAVLGIVPFAGILGFVTPLMLDYVASGDPSKAGSAYGVNIIGCVLGPLLGGFILLPAFGERGSLALLAASWFVIALFFNIYLTRPVSKAVRLRRSWALVALGLTSAALFASTEDFADQFSRRIVRRDYTATVIATGESRKGKRLLVNGVGITNLTPETKLMAHLPLVMLNRPPNNALDICFGMGTTQRSLLSWNISSTAVELVSSVPSLYGYFFVDGPELLRSPKSILIIDDGRFYLERSNRKYDVITIDPPPPVEAAGSSLLYSTEFYTTVKQHLSEGGIFQQWLPNGDSAVIASVGKALQESFPYVLVFGAIEGQGYHFIASISPIDRQTPSVLASRMPASAVKDLLEWGPFDTAQDQLTAVLSREVSLGALIQLSPRVPILRDDRPINEYFLLRRLGNRAFLERMWQKLLGSVGQG